MLDLMMNTLESMALASIAFYRSSDDAGMWMLDRQFMTAYLESFFISKGKM